MTDFLAQMAHQSAVRVARARACESEASLRQRGADLPPAPPLVQSGAGFDLIAEVKRRSPSGGVLARAAQGPADVPAEVVAQAVAYAAGGAVAISVLTEPEHFDGALSHVAAVAAAVPVPVMRKDFLVDPYQVCEARAAGAAGVLLIVRLLHEALLREMLAAALELQLFVLLECFDAADIDRAAVEAARLPHARSQVFLGLNVRDLSTFALDLDRLEQLQSRFPPGVPRVAESGLASPADAHRAAALGYALGLAGTALMRAADPARATSTLIAAGRAAVAPRLSAGTALHGGESPCACA